ncbi:hypothetical protein J6W20_01595 [bacterium]|nr:hypothetical protein [bacterium]
MELESLTPGSKLTVGLIKSAFKTTCEPKANSLVLIKVPLFSFAMFALALNEGVVIFTVSAFDVTIWLLPIENWAARMVFCLTIYA